MLSSLKIKNFRSLQDVEIPKLGLLNLIVGNNNSGKSSLIEALLIYANSSDETLLNELAYSHGEPLLFDRDEEENISSFLPCESFFSNRSFPKEDNVKIEIGEVDNENNVLSIEHCFERELLIKIDDEDGGGIRRIKYEPISKSELEDSSIKNIISLRDPELNDQIRSILKVERNGAIKRIFLDDLRRRPSFRGFDAKYNIPYSYIPTSFLNADELALDWDKLVLTPYQDHIIEALKIIEPNVENISFIKSGKKRRSRFRNSEESPGRTPIVKLSTQSRPFPLSSMGDGMLRVLQLIIKLHSARDGILLVDEFDNGLHHSVQEKVWELVFSLAKDLNIQVFATTHSYDCVKAFSKVARDRLDIEGILIQMGKSARKSNYGQVIPSILDEKELATFINSHLEVR